MNFSLSVGSPRDRAFVLFRALSGVALAFPGFSVRLRSVLHLSEWWIMLRTETICIDWVRPRTAVALMMVLATGCGGNTGPILAPVSGTVTYNGEAVEGAVVEFIQPGLPIRSMGESDSTGHYSINSYAENDGAPIGRCAVTVTKTVIDLKERDRGQTEKGSHIEKGDTPPSTDLRATKDADYDDVPNMSQRMRASIAYRRGIKPRSQIPTKYADPKSSGLSLEVKRGVVNDYQIELKD